MSSMFSLSAVAATVTLALSVTPLSLRAQITIQATVAESGFQQNIYGGNNPFPAGNQGQLTSADRPDTIGTTEPTAPWNFSANFNSLASITAISITLTLTNGSTDANGIPGNLTLGLNGIDTGVVLDNFGSFNAISRLTFTNVPVSPAVGSSLLTSLQASGGLVNGTIIGAAGTAANFIQITMGDPTAGATQPQTILSLTGAAVPEPATVTLLGAGVLALGVAGVRRRQARD